MNFFKCLSGTCKGTGVFPELLKQSPGRALWHLLIICFACTLLILACSYPGYSSRINETFKVLEDNFGALRIVDNRLTAARLEEDKALLLADNQIRINYLTSLKNGIPEIDAGGIQLGFLWTPTMLAAWFKSSPEKFLLIPFAYNAAKDLPTANLKFNEIKSYIEKNTSPKSKLICQFPELSWEALKDYSLKTLVSLMFFSEFGGILLQVLFFVTIFSFILNLSSRNNRMPLLRYSERFVIGVYASFPPLLVAAVFRAFELPYLSFNTVYIIGFSIYLIVIFARLQMALDAGLPRNRE